MHRHTPAKWSCWVKTSSLAQCRTCITFSSQILGAYALSLRHISLTGHQPESSVGKHLMKFCLIKRPFIPICIFSIVHVSGAPLMSSTNLISALRQEYLLPVLGTLTLKRVTRFFILELWQRLLILKLLAVYVSCNVTFQENVFPQHDRFSCFAYSFLRC